MELQTVWFFLWGLLWAVFFMTDGFDFGIGTLYPFIARNENEKKTLIHAMGPFWDGNEVWLVAAGGVTFAAFPLVYATMFSSLYTALMLILFALILRGVAMEFRDQVDDRRWRMVWEFCLFFGSVTPAVLFGVAFANIFKGIPIDGDGVYHGSLFTLLNGYGLLGGALFLLLFLVHGALWLAIKSEGELHERAAKTAGLLWWPLLLIAVAFLVATKYETNLYANYIANPVLFLLMLVNVAALLQTKIFTARNSFLAAWFSSALTIVCCTFFGVVGLFPNVFPSSLDAAYSLTAFNASSSPLTLTIMLVVAAIFVPIVIAYQTWTYITFIGKVTEADLSEETY